MTKKVEEFKARADDGRTFTICKYQPDILDGTLDDLKATLPGLPYFRTSDGAAVNERGNGIYEIVHLRLKVRRLP